MARLELDYRLELDRLVRVVVALVRVGRLRAVLGVESEQVAEVTLLRKVYFLALMAASGTG